VDSTNLADDALRNRLRRHVIPLLRQENPNLSRTVARMTDLLRQDEAYLARAAEELLERAARDGGYDCPTLLAAPEVLRRRAIRRLLPVEKPAHGHVLQVERLLSGGEGSASVELPKGVKAVREYDLLCLRMPAPGTFSPVVLRPGETVFAAGLKITMEYPRIPEKEVEFALKYDMMEETPVFTVRPRRSGDTLRLSGGTKSLKKLMIDRKIPRSQRDLLPVLEDAAGIFAVYGLGADASRKAAAGEPAWIIQIEKEERTGNEDEPN
jgi:tRNA(Ile)-lysidine synthase